MTPFFLGFTLLPIFLPSPLSGTGGWGRGVAISSSHIVSVAPFSSYSSPSPAWGPSYGRQSSTNFSSMGPSIGLVNQEQIAAAWAPFSLSPHVLPGACSIVGFPWGHSLPWASICSSMGNPSEAAGGFLLYCGSSWTAGGQLPHHGLHRNLCSDAWSTFFSFTWCQQAVCFSHIFSILFFECCWCCIDLFLPPLLKYVAPEMLLPSLMDSVLASGVSILELVGIDFLGPRGSFQQLLT